MQSLDEVFVISRIINVEVGVISRSRRPRLIILTEIISSLNGQHLNKVLKYVYPIKRYNCLRFEFPAILLLKRAKTEVLKRYIFGLDRHISILFSVLRSL